MTGATECGVLLGDSAAMLALRSMITRVARTKLSVLIQGETGTGKELVAQALHRGSKRDGSLVALNVCAITETMFEASLFGHVRGAFTGAVGDSLGFMAEANGGTLFLDEISGLPAPAQAKLLRAVETKVFRPVGARMDRRSDFRVVAATNEDLHQLVVQGKFRADLLQRLSAVCLRVPPLRDRREDIPGLVSFFAGASGDGALHARDARFTTGAVQLLRAHSWPGNVRELRHVVECALALADSPVITTSDIEPLLAPDVGASAAERHDAVEHRELLLALEACEWDVERVARRLGVHRATIYRRLKRIHPKGREVSGSGLSAPVDASWLQLEA